ncbi:Vacuolar protein sorting-associated protein 16 [Dioscorea alata]|uniref:Vacuolar protein sorting-associated protein 16 n=1 Tax=Dioscorea alata TaxID=55571 RepID=A0ACB7TVG5_DIOAL|nr:Vacuolar protein sorting-associated protein 16 [Dioscorea alata]
MAAVSVAAEWELLYNRYYRKPEIYSMRWGRMDLSRHRVACAPFGGPVAAIRDDSKIVQLLAESARRKLLIFSSSGQPLASYLWDRPGGRLVGMAWDDDLFLLCVVQDGTVYRFDIRAELVGQFSMGSECFEQGIIDCVFWGNGIVCITENYQIFCVPDLKNPRPCKLADPGLEEYPLCVAVIEPQYTMSGNVEVLLGVGDYVLLVDEDGVQPLGAGIGPLQKMAVSQNGKLLATFTHDGRLLVIPTDFSRIIFEFTCESALPPDQLAWCGMDTVLLYWDELLLMVGPNGDPVRYSYDEPILLIPECDGVRILSNSSMEFLHRVPDSTVSIFQIGSTSPAALLYDALDHFDRRSAKADENLRLIRSSLPEAVEACIDAAGHEFDVSRQRTLLRAASYGRAFCSQFPRERFQEMCKILRVLNAVRNYEIGIPLSIQQYKVLTAPVLIDRLINANHHLVALRISEYINLNPEVVVMHWACAKITASAAIQDVPLLETLLDKLKLCKGISYAAIAAHADNCGRRKLAALLVDHEPRSSKQVPLLLSIAEEDTALVKATESGDTDLVYLVLFHIWQKRPPLDFFGTINARPLARDLFIKYVRCYKHEFLKDFFLSTGQLQDVAFLLLKESWEIEKNPMASKGTPLHGPRIKLIEKAQNLFAETKEHMFESKAAEEHAKLLRIQHELEVSTKQAIFMDSSISDTIRTCISTGNHRAAMKVRTEFKVPEKRWYWLKALALSTRGDWAALEKFSKEKRPPGGYKPFVEACIGADAKAEALKYIPKLTEPRERSEAYARIGMAKEAADAASQAKDSEFFGRLRLTLGQNAGATSIFDSLRDRLSFQGVY